jgi:hypothetical protein
MRRTEGSPRCASAAKVWHQDDENCPHTSDWCVDNTHDYCDDCRHELNND